MPISMYEASAPVFVRQLRAASAILAKGEAHDAAHGIDPAELIAARLAPDMHPLPRQVQFASDSAKGAVARLAGIEVPSFADTETSFADLQERIARTVAFIESVPADGIDGSEEREIVLKVGPQDLRFTGRHYLLGFALPNFFFHVTATYAILRHVGVPVGKRDFLAGL